MQFFGYPVDVDPILFTLEVATITSIVLLLIGTPMPGGLPTCAPRPNFSGSTGCAAPRAATDRARFLSDHRPQSEWRDRTVPAFVRLQRPTDLQQTGLVIGSVVYSLPFTVQPIMAAFEALPTQILMPPVPCVLHFSTDFLPSLSPGTAGFLVGVVLTFDTVGEFGVV